MQILTQCPLAATQARLHLRSLTNVTEHRVIQKRQVRQQSQVVHRLEHIVLLKTQNNYWVDIDTYNGE